MANYGKDYRTNKTEAGVAAMRTLFASMLLIGLSGVGYAQGTDKIVFQTTIEGNNKEIFSMDLDGSNLVNLTNHPSFDEGPACSPDGTKIAFTSNRAPGGALFVMNADGSNPTNLTNDETEANYGAPSWSPDGRQIAVARFPGEFEEDPVDTGWNLYLINADGTDLRKLGGEDGLIVGATWSPNGQQLLFTSAGSINVINIDGSGLRQLTDTGLSVAVDPKWSPDGRQIVFEGWTTDPTINVHVMNEDGSNLRQLTHIPDGSWPIGAWSPTWSPNGEQIAFVSNRNDESNVYIINADGQNERRITTADMFYETVCWLSIGDQIPTLINLGSWGRIKQNPTGQAQR